MKLLDYVNDVAQRASRAATQGLVNNETTKDHLIRQFNMFHKDFNKRYPWPWLSKDSVFQTVSNYTDGTVTVTNGSRAVTGSGTVFTSAMAGRFLKLNSDLDTYEILSVTNGSTLVLKVPYLGTSVSGSYLIWKKFYELDPEVPYLSDITLAMWPYISNEFPKKEFDGNLIRAWQENSISLIWTWGGIDRTGVTYNTGTIAVTQDSRTLTGVGTAFLGNVFGGSRIRIGASYYNVESVDSDTQITMVQMATISVSTTSDYSIESKNRSRIQLSSVPRPQINIGVHFSKRTYDLVNDNDEPELWSGHEHIITDVMYGYLLEKLTSQKSFTWLDVYRGKIREAWINLNERTSTEQVPRASADRTSGYRPTIYG